MGFQDNSGDIIFDVVLTDEGRRRLARGDGSFNVSHFALGDEEINYALFNTATGSAYQDIKILQTPILEAFTNNTSTMKSKLISISRTNILHMPVLKLQNGGNSSQANRDNRIKGSALHSSTNVANTYIITSDTDTTELVSESDATLQGSGIIIGAPGTTQHQNPNASNLNQIVVEHGIDTTEIAGNILLPSDLQETQFIMQMDYRLGYVCSTDGTEADVSFIDDDQIATYYITDSRFVKSGAHI